MSHYDPDDIDRLLLIRIKHAYPAFRARLERCRGKGDRLSEEELAELIRVAFAFFVVSSRLMSYVAELGGRSEN